MDIVCRAVVHAHSTAVTFGSVDHISTIAIFKYCMVWTVFITDSAGKATEWNAID